MYCSSCGSALAQNLSYCNRCGTKVSGAKADSISKPAELYSVSLVNGIAAVFIVGLGAIIGLMAVMKKVIGFDLDIILAITIFCLVLMLAVESVLIRLLVKHRRDAQNVDDTAPPKGHTTKELGEARVLETLAPVPSVTEHTTRAFEPLYSERESK